MLPAIMGSTMGHFGGIDLGGAKIQAIVLDEHGRTRLSSGVWARAVERGDALATRTIERALRASGAGIASGES